MSYESTEVRQIQIADAALKVIAERGLARFTTRAVAAEVGLTDGALFRHFKDKLGIVHAAMDRLEEALFDGFPDEGATALDRLEGFFRRRATLVGSRSVVGRLVFSEQLVHAAGEEGVERVARWRQRSVGFLEARAGEAMDLGQIRGDLSPNDIAQLIQGVVLTIALDTNPSHHTLELDQRVERSWNTLRTVLEP